MPSSMDAGILTTVLKSLLFTILGGYSRIHDQAFWLMGKLVIIDIALAGIFWMWAKEGVLAGFFQRILYYSVFLGIFMGWMTLTPWVLNSFVAIGLTAGGSTMTVTEFTNPSKIAELGLIATEPIFKKVAVWGLLGGVSYVLDGFCGLLILGAFFAMAIEMFVFLLEFYISAVLSSFLVIFGVNRYTAFIAEGAMGNIVAHGVKVMCLAFVTSASFPTLILLKLDPDPQFKQIAALALGTLAIVVLAWKTPKWALGLLGAGPQLTAGVFAASVIGGAMVAGTIGNKARGGISRARQAVRAATRLDPRRQS